MDATPATAPEQQNVAQQLAKASWGGFLLGIFVVWMGSSSAKPMLPFTFIAMGMYALGFVAGVLALVLIPKYGREKVLLPAFVGICLCALPLAAFGVGVSAATSDTWREMSHDGHRYTILAPAGPEKSSFPMENAVGGVGEAEVYASRESTAIAEVTTFQTKYDPDEDVLLRLADAVEGAMHTDQFDVERDGVRGYAISWRKDGHQGISQAFRRGRLFNVLVVSWDPKSSRSSTAAAKMLDGFKLK